MLEKTLRKNQNFTASQPLHQPVLLQEVMDLLLPISMAEQSTTLRLLDLTFGRGGHTRAFLQKFPQLQVWACDQDPEAISFGHEHFQSEIAQGRLHLLHTNFRDIPTSLIEMSENFDAILADLGVSSPQLDQAGRGFSFYQDGPLDMRMNQNAEDETAADVINTWDEKDLIRLFQVWGEIPRPQRVVRALVHDRRTVEFTHTQQLASLIERVDGWRRKGMHPATQYFMALRIAVNDELRALEDMLPLCLKLLKPHQGRLAVISFHSLEDRIVKQTFRSWVSQDQGELLNKKIITATEDEMKSNSRSRSAKLRGFIRE